MNLIRLECEQCRTYLQVRPELAGRKGRCPKCGAVLDIPSPEFDPTAASALSGVGLPGPQDTGMSGSSASPSSTIVAQMSITDMTGEPPRTAAPPPPPPAAPKPAAVGPPRAMPLAQATAPDMLAEIARRRKSAVLVVFETPADGAYEVARRPEANVRCYRTPDMTDAQLLDVLSQVGGMAPGRANVQGGVTLQAEGGPLPYELKGDRLGSTLEEFKAKYARRLGAIQMPYCSDSCPGDANEALRSEPWHAAAGIVHARIDLPSESNPPTLAGEKTELWLYHFVDGKLFRMTVLADTEAFHHIHEALVQKAGPPNREIKEPLEYLWDNGVSGMRLVRGAMRPRKPSMLILYHLGLQKIAETRVPRRSADV